MLEKTQAREAVGAPVYFFPHIPKCAGASVKTHLEAHLSSEVATFFYGPQARRAWQGGSRPETKDIRFMGGHRLRRRMVDFFPGRDIRECIILRDPVHFMVSMYNFLRSERGGSGLAGISFDDWYKGYSRNRVTRFLLRDYLEWPSWRWQFAPGAIKLAAAKRILDNAWFVGTTTDLDRLMAQINAELGIPPEMARDNVAGIGALRASELDQGMIARIKRENALDMKLVQHAENISGRHGPDAVAA